MTTLPTSPSSDTPPQERDEAQSVGQMLKQARLGLGLSLADVAAVTRVPRNMLEHLERDRLEEYAAPVFARGHLMNFAREVRLDPERILGAYDRQTGMVRPSLEFEPPMRPRQTPRRKSPGSLRKKYPQMGRISEFVRPIHMVTALLLMCALFASAFFLNGSSATAQKPAEFESAPSSEESWSLEKDAKQARWFLEQPSAGQTATP